jgi:hypothetical protein
VIQTQFAPEPIGAEQFFVGLFEAQVSRRSPLAWAARFTDFAECVNGPNQRMSRSPWNFVVAVR